MIQDKKGGRGGRNVGGKRDHVSKVVTGDEEIGEKT